MWFIFSTPVLIGHMWQLKTVVFLHWCLIRALPSIENILKQQQLSAPPSVGRSIFIACHISETRISSP